MENGGFIMLCGNLDKSDNNRRTGLLIKLDLSKNQLSIMKILACFILFVNVAFAQTVEFKMSNIGQTLKIESKILNETKEVLISLPTDFDSAKEYPLVLLSDFMAFKTLASITEIMAYNKTIPQCIVICPVFTNVREEYSPSIDISEEGLTGGKTIQFYEKDLFPFLESKYKISKKIIWGQNHSGMFVTFIMLNKPSLFDCYLADIPPLDPMKADIETEKCFRNIGTNNIFYQITWTAMAPQPQMTKKFIEKLEFDAPANLTWKYSQENDSILITHVVTNYTYGLKTIFEN